MSDDEHQAVDHVVGEPVDWIELLAELADVATFTRRYSSLDTPDLVAIKAGSPTDWAYGGRFLSVAVVNPNAFTVYVGSGGSSGVAGLETVALPGNAWVVLPVRGRGLSLGAGANAGSVYVLPFKTAQPFAAGNLGAVVGTGTSASVVTKEALTGALQTLLAANTARKAATIYCDAATTLYVKLGAAATADDWTVKLLQDDYYELPGGYTGIVTGISAAAVGQARVTELS